MSLKLASAAILAVGIVSAIPAKADEMGVDEARRFIAGKYFAYSCFDGTSGDGKIYADGSVAGYIQEGGTGPRRFVALPAGTLRLRGTQYCASLPGVPFEPCFTLIRASNNSFRGSLFGLAFAYCDFVRRGGGRADLHQAAQHGRDRSRPLVISRP